MNVENGLCDVLLVTMVDFVMRLLALFLCFVLFILVTGAL